jgi:hypothetical protein
MNDKAKVALLTSDTYRIAAVEQLRIYANILCIPLKVVYTDEEIKEVSWHPQMEGIDELLLTAMECTIIGLRSVNELFSLGLAGEIEEYSQRYHELAKKLTTDEID